MNSWSYVYDENKNLLSKYFNLKSFNGRCFIRLCTMSKGDIAFQLSSNEIGFHSVLVNTKTVNDIQTDFPFVEIQ